MRRNIRMSITAVMAGFLLFPGLLWAGPAHQHGRDEGGGMSAHMARMAETREQLEQRLGDRYDAPVRDARPGEIARGKAVYARNCASCHGVGGKGDGPAGKSLNPPAADLTDPMHAYFYSDQGRLEIIRSGSPGTAMPGWKNTLSEDDLMAVFQYVRTLRPPQDGMHMAASDHGMMDHDHMGHEEKQHGQMGDEHAGHDMDHMGKDGKMTHRLEASDDGLRGKLEPASELVVRQKAKLLLRLTDESGQPVRAKKVQVRWSMPAMGHDLDTVTAVPQKDAGVYRISYTFPMGGHYRAEATVTLTDGAVRHLTFEVMVP